MENLNAVAWSNYIVDGIVALAFFIFVFSCARKGFISCLFGILSTLVAIILVFTLSKPLLDATNGLFGLQDFFAGKFETFFSKLDGFDVDISSVGVETALEEGNVSAIFSKLILQVAGKGEPLAEGATLGLLLGQGVAKLAATLVIGLVIFILVKLLLRILRKLLTSTIEKIPLLSGVNSLLGAIFGFLYALFFVCVALAIATILPIDSISNYLDKTLFVGWLYDHNPLVFLLSKIL